MKREYRKWFSPNLQRNMELLVFGHAGEPVLFFPTRTARFYDYEDWRIIEAIRYKIEAGFIQVFCVDSVDSESFYASIHPADKIRRHLQYEQYILQEVLPLIRYTNPLHNGIATAGCSLGGYHALNIAFRHPWLFSKAIGMSSRYDLTLSADKFPNLLNGYFDEHIYFNMPSMYMPNLTNTLLLEQIRRLKIEIAVGKEDPFFENNQRLSDTLTNKSIPHQLHVWDEEAHRPRYWRKMVQWYL